MLGDRWRLPQVASFPTPTPEIDEQFTMFVSPAQTDAPDGAFRFIREPLSDENATYLFSREALMVASLNYWDKLGAPETIDAPRRYAKQEPEDLRKMAES